MTDRGRTKQLALALAALVLALVLAWKWWPRDAPERTQAGSAAEVPAAAARPAAAAGRADDPGGSGASGPLGGDDDERPVRRPSEGLAPEDAPEPLGIATVERPADTSITPAFRAEKTARMLELLKQRAARIESEIAAADAAGDRDRADQLRVILARVRARVDAVSEELEVGGPVEPAEPAEPAEPIR